MNQDNVNTHGFLVGDLVCLANARTQEVFTITAKKKWNIVRTAFVCGGRPFLAHEIEPKTLQKGDWVRQNEGPNERYEVSFADDSYIELIDKDGYKFQSPHTEFRAVAPTAQIKEFEGPSFMVGDIVREKGDGEDGSFIVRQLLDGGRTVILGDGLESQHTALEPESFRVGDWIRSFESSNGHRRRHRVL